jgi:hypothetical protein
LLRAAALAVMLTPRSGRADERRASARRPQLVVVDYPNSAFTDPELHAAVRELLSRIQVRAVPLAQAAEGEVIAYAHVLMGHDEVSVTVEDARGQHGIARRSVPRGDSPELLRETLAHVLLGLVEPLSESAQITPSQALSDQAGTPSDRRRAAFVPQLGMHGGPLQVTTETWSARFVGSGALAWDSRLGHTLALDVSAALPVAVDKQGVRARVLLAGSRLRARITPWTLTHVMLDTSLSVGLDVISIRPKSAPSGTDLGGTSIRGQPVLGIAVGGRTRVRTRMELVLGLGLDLDPMPRSWQLETGPMHDTVFETTLFRPYATLGLDWLLRAQPAKPAAEVAP